MMSGASGIMVSGLMKRFTPDKGPVEGVELCVPTGALTLITGGPGSGKSTLVRCLTGVYLPDAGRVIFRLNRYTEVDLTGIDPRAVAWLRGHHIASFDGPLAAAPQLPAVDALARAARRDRPAALAALARLRTEHLAAVPVGRLRPHHRNAVALAAALLTERRFVVLDEPESSVDPGSVAEWVQQATQAGAAVFATAPIDSALASIATATGELREGQIQWHRR